MILFQLISLVVEYYPLQSLVVNIYFIFYAYVCYHELVSFHMSIYFTLPYKSDITNLTDMVLDFVMNSFHMSM